MKSLSEVWQEFRERWSEGRFVLQRCSRCNEWWFYPNVVCTSCGSTDSAWSDLTGNGVVTSFTNVPQRPTGGSRAVVCCALVELSEGVQLFGRFDGDDASLIDVVIGGRVRIDRFVGYNGPFVFTMASI